MLCVWDLPENMVNPCWALDMVVISSPSLCCCQSITPTLILKRWKSCCLSLSSLFVFILNSFLLLASPPSLLPPLPVSLLFLWSADKEFCCLLPQCCQGKQVAYSWGVFLHLHFYLCVILFSLHITCLAACLCGTHWLWSFVCSLYVCKRQRACLSWVPRRGLDIVVFYQHSFLWQALTISLGLPLICH